MLGSAFWLTLATLLGLCLGFAREWLLVASWGAGERSDAFLIALFLPEALRMSLAGGVLSAAALPLFLERQAEVHFAHFENSSFNNYFRGRPIYLMLDNTPMPI